MEGFTDKDLGCVLVRRNSRSKRMIARYKDGHIFLTVPPHYSTDTIKRLFEELKPQLLDFEPKKAFIFNETTQLETLSFKLLITRHKLQTYHGSLKDGMLVISCPETTDFEKEEVQGMIRNYIESVFRAEAKRILPSKVELLAKKYGFNYTAVKINNSKTRWGSCSSRKSINLSFFLLIQPLHLVEFVILHELCHTLEMNHGDRFWALLDKVTGNKARELTKELKISKAMW
ncbi:M48 family metallopeptidase [Viscerimonas tarda]